MIKVKCPKCGAISETDKQSSFCKAITHQPTNPRSFGEYKPCNGFMVTQRDKINAN